MGRDGEWIRDEADEDDWEEGPIGPGGPAGLGPAGYGKRWGHGGAPGFPGWIALAVAVVAAAAGVTAGFFLVRGAPVASATAGARPSASAPTSAPASSGSGAGLPVRPGLPGNASGNGQVRMLLTGRVLAVSATSITIGGAGPAVTAAITSATKLIGGAHAIDGVKVGDEVAAEITGTPSHLVTITLQDPAQ